MDMMNLFCIGVVIIIAILIGIATIDTINNPSNIEAECKADCEVSNMEYYKVKYQTFGRNSCLCLGENGIKRIWD